MDGEMLEQNLKCPICFNIVDEPNETSCCGHLFCAKCVKSLKKQNCPICRSNKVNFRENSFVRNLLSSLLAKCPYGCELKIPLANVKYHRYTCSVSAFKCTILINGQKCKFEGTKNESLRHFAEVHSDQMIILAENFSSLKNSYDKHSMFEKLNKIMLKEKLEKEKERIMDKDVFQSIKDDDEYNEVYFNENHTIVEEQNKLKESNNNNNNNAISENKINVNSDLTSIITTNLNSNNMNSNANNNLVFPNKVNILSRKNTQTENKNQYNVKRSTPKFSNGVNMVIPSLNLGGIKRNKDT